jgi:hypothetical protein
MRLPRRTHLVALVAAALALTLPGGPAAQATSTGPGACPAGAGTSTQPVCRTGIEDVGSGFDSETVAVPTYTAGTTLNGTAFAPRDRWTDTGDTQPRSLPGVVVLHGMGGNQYAMFWIARALASRGYVTLAITVPASGSNDAFANGLRAGVRFLHGGAGTNPYASFTDVDRLAVLGHSEGARAASAVQDPTYGLAEQAWVDTVVALDNLSSDLGGDAGTGLVRPTRTCTQTPFKDTGPTDLTAQPIRAQRPALGIAEDTTSTNCTGAAQNPPAVKQAGWALRWHTDGTAYPNRFGEDVHLDSALLVLGGSNHFSYYQKTSSTAVPAQTNGAPGITVDDLHARVVVLTTAWLDRVLRGSPAGYTELVAHEQWLSSTYTSGVHLPSNGCSTRDLVTTTCS